MQATIRRPVCAVKDKRTLTVGGGKNEEQQELEEEQAGSDSDDSATVPARQQSDARRHLAGNAFFIVFLCYPRVCNSAFHTFICRTVELNPKLVSVLVADDRVLCEDDEHLLYKWLSYGVIGVFALGVPFGAAWKLYRERAAQKRQEVKRSLKLRTAEAFEIQKEEASMAIADIRRGSVYGFLVNAFKPKFFFWESMCVSWLLSMP